MQKNKTKNYILKNENAVYYECGFSCDNVIFLNLEDEKYFITDSRYTYEAKRYLKDTLVVEARDLVKKAREILRKKRIKRLILDPKEWSLAEFEELNKVNIFFVKRKDFSKNKRIIKTKEEIELLKKASLLGKEAFLEFERLLREKELLQKDEYELNFLIQNLLKRDGKYPLSFDPIVALDENAALPHALPTSKKLKEDSLVLVDAGLKYQRYCSDRTRTYINKKDKFQQKIYDIVKKAHDKALEIAREGVLAKEVDLAARRVIDEAGYGKYFLHSTGHGVGLDIHEFPVISKNSETILKEGMVFTIEPGIYIENKFGIRYENMIVIQDQKAKIL